MATQTVLIIGAGQAGMQLAASLREEGFNGPVCLVGNEALRPYQRPPLSKGLLTGEVEDEELFLESTAFFAQSDIEFIGNDQAVSVDRDERRLQLASGRTLAYDKLVFATGARNRSLPCMSQPMEGVVSLRSLGDAQGLRDRLGKAQSMVVVGAGFLGLEVASVAVELGVEVLVVEAMASPMQRVLSAPAAQAVMRHHESRGVRFVLNRSVARLHESAGHVERVELDDGTLVAADLVLVAVGVVPNTELAQAAGLAVANGIVVDHTLQSADEHVFAIGDCASFACGDVTPAWHRLESVQNAVDQARYLAKRLTGQGLGYSQVPLFWSDQGGLRVQIAGVAAHGDSCVLRGDANTASFSVFRYRDGRLTAVEAVNKPADVQLGRRLLTRAVSPPAAQAADTSFDLKRLLA